MKKGNPADAPAAPGRRRRRAFEGKTGQRWQPRIGAFALRRRWRLDRITLRRTPDGFQLRRKQVPWPAYAAPRPARPTPPPRPAPPRPRSRPPRPASKRVQVGHPQVFRWQYYLDENPALRASGIHTRDQALVHWKARGIQEGRCAHPSFSPVDYLRMHADVRLEARRAGVPPLHYAITHWLQQGLAEGRQGRVAPPPAAAVVEPVPEPAPPPEPQLSGLAARLAQILEGTGGAAPAEEPPPEEAPSYLNVELPAALRKLLKKSD